MSSRATLWLIDVFLIVLGELYGTEVEDILGFRDTHTHTDIHSSIHGVLPVLEKKVVNFNGTDVM